MENALIGVGVAVVVLLAGWALLRYTQAARVVEQDAAKTAAEGLRLIREARAAKLKEAATHEAARAEIAALPPL